MQIDYIELKKAAMDAQGVIVIEKLIKLLEDEWLAAYYDMSNHRSMVLEFPFNGFTYLFDQASANTNDVDDRAVVAYGISSKEKHTRDKNRQREFLGGGLDISEKGKFDKGHLIACAMGGGLDVNLFPQRSELNQGISEAGRIYRTMEVYAEQHPGTFVFSRLIYNDDSWIPSALEYGIIKDGKLWVEWFEN
jgi:hypothetical protein